MKYLILLLSFSAHAQDWGRHETATFRPPVQMTMPQIATSAVQPTIAIPQKQPWEITAKDYPKLYLPPVTGIFATPPNIGETSATRRK